MRAGVWAYPTWFSETSCITAMEAQAAGLMIVSSAIAALPETVGRRGSLIDWGDPLRSDPRTPLREYRDAFIADVVSAMNSPDGRWHRRDGFGYEQLAEIAREAFSLDTLADEWSEMLTEIHADVTENVVPKFVHLEAAQ